MYKIYINELPLYIVSGSTIGNYGPADAGTLIMPYLGKEKSLNAVMDICENPGDLKRVIIYSDQPSKILTALKKMTSEIPAAGGIVLNQFNEILYIYRRGFWDLPKGKLDPGETTEVAAVREVMEETGIKRVSITQHIDSTYHIFRTAKNGYRYLKTTDWFAMSTQKQKLIIQREEDIEEALWITPELFLEKCKPSYNNIRDIIQTYLSKVSMPILHEDTTQEIKPD